MAAPLLLDLSHTAHTRARTGIQRVARALRANLGEQAASVTFDPFLGQWRTLRTWESDRLAATDPGLSRGTSWPLAAKLGGRLRRMLRTRSEPLPMNSGIVVPEVFSPSVAAALPAILDAVTGPRVALFHDAIALKLPDLTPAGTVARFPAYLRELLAFDGIAAVSEDSRRALLDYWDWLGITNRPEVTTLALGLDLARRDAPLAVSNSSRPVVLCVGSIEGRKNHRSLLDACAKLWTKGVDFELHVIGMPRPETARPAIEMLEALQAAGRPLRYDGAASDAALERAYAEASFTVYPSLMEGFGLPVLESLAHGKPCICSSRGALGESTRGGGCVALEDVTAQALGAAIERLLNDSDELRRLAAEARRRTFRTWDAYVSDLTGWIRTLTRKARTAQGPNG